MKYCTKCLMPETRPRITFNKDGVCNGCEWAEKKEKEVDWNKRWKELEELCDEYRIIDGSNWDVIVPCSFGKDSYHIAWMLKTKFNMHPLLVYVAPLIPSKIGLKNKENLLDHGFDAIQIDLNRDIYKRLCRAGFEEQGRPQLAFVSVICTSPVIIAQKLGVPFIMYGEEGESEYGGAMGLHDTPKVTRDWIINKYLSGVDPIDYVKYGFSKEDLKWWVLPSQEELDEAGLFITHWSYFENWNHQLHRDTALGIGFKTTKDWKIYHKSVDDIGVTNIATYTDYTSLDDPLMRTFHTYLMFLKFGWGRGSQEATNDIRIGKMTREEGIKIAKKYDNYDCSDFKDKILRRYNITENEYNDVIDKWANKDILQKVNNKWVLGEPIS